ASSKIESTGQTVFSSGLPIFFCIAWLVMFSPALPLEREVTTILEETTMSIHKHLKTFFGISGMLALIICLTATTKAQSILTDDAHTINSPKDGDSNFGSNPNLFVSSVNNTYLKFKLSTTLPTGVQASDVAKATLKLYVGTVNSAGAIDVYQADAAWNERTI